MSDEMRRPVHLPPGTVVGDYRVLRYLASGQWGSVYAARRITEADDVSADVALKILPGGSLAPAGRGAVAEVADRERRFSHAARHARLIRTHEVLTLPDGSLVLVMELARTDLRSLLAARAGRPPPDAVELLRQLWEALAYMHGRGWVHGDLKPANVLIAADGTVRVGDFGLAAELEGTHGWTVGFGTPDYLPPEWWDQGLDSRGVITRPATDLWAYGIIAHEVLTGGLHPFPGATPQARAGAMRAYAGDPGQLRLSPDVPEAWQKIIRDCLRPGHADRLAATRDLGRRLSAGPGRRTRRAWLRPVAAVVTVASTLTLASSLSPRPHDTVPLGRAPVSTPPELRPGELRPEAAVPPAYRDIITRTAHACPKPSVTPALIAAMLWAESRFDPAKRSPQTDEYGIAMWTPSVFAGWAPRRNGRVASVFDPEDAITAMGPFLCHLADTVGYLPGDARLLIAAGYRVGGKAVRRADGIPPQAATYTATVAAKLTEFGY